MLTTNIAFTAKQAKMLFQTLALSIWLDVFRGNSAIKLALHKCFFGKYIKQVPDPKGEFSNRIKN